MQVLETIAAFLLQYALRILGLGHLHRRRVVFFSYFGSQYSCNPKYLSEFLVTNHPEFEVVWAFSHPEDYSFLSNQGITVIPYNTLRFVRTCLTSRFIVTNSELPAWFPVSSRQVLINTWHGGGAYKRVGADFSKGSVWQDLRSAIGRSKPCVYLSSSTAFTRLTIRESFRHKGEVIECGMPRNDLLVLRDKPLLEDRVKRALGIPSSNKLLLYAPTYREGRKASSYLFDFESARQALSQRFGGTWTVVLRMHYFVMQQLPQSESFVDASGYPDMQELLYASDVLITDYSSSIWDFGLMGKPCFLYATDLDSYDAERGFYSDIHSWPWPLAENNEQLEQEILNFDETAFERRLAAHYQDLGSKETGHACEAAADYLLSHA